MRRCGAVRCVRCGRVLRCGDGCGTMGAVRWVRCDGCGAMGAVRWVWCGRVRCGGGVVAVRLDS